MYFKSFNKIAWVICYVNQSEISTAKSIGTSTNLIRAILSIFFSDLAQNLRKLEGCNSAVEFCVSRSMFGQLVGNVVCFLIVFVFPLACVLLNYISNCLLTVCIDTGEPSLILMPGTHMP